MNGGRVRDAQEPEPKCMSSTGELIDIERVTISSEGDRWKSTRWGNSLAVYPTARPVLRLTITHIDCLSVWPHANPRPATSSHVGHATRSVRQASRPSDD